VVRPPAAEKNLRLLATSIGHVGPTWLEVVSLGRLFGAARSGTGSWSAKFNENHSNDVVTSIGRRVQGERADAFVYWVDANPKEKAP